MCKSWCEAILAIVILVVGFMVSSPMWAKWTLVVVGLILLIHSFTCKSCFMCEPMEASSAKKATVSKRK